MPKSDNSVEIEVTRETINSRNNGGSPIHMGQNKQGAGTSSRGVNNSSLATGVPKVNTGSNNRKNSNSPNNSDKMPSVNPPKKDNIDNQKPNSEANPATGNNLPNNEGKDLNKPDPNDPMKGVNNSNKKPIENDPNNPMGGVKAPDNNNNDGSGLINGMPGVKKTDKNEKPGDSNKKPDNKDNKNNNGNKINKKGDHKNSALSYMQNIANRVRSTFSNGSSSDDDSSGFNKIKNVGSTLLSTASPQGRFVKFFIEHKESIGVVLLIGVIFVILFVTTTTPTVIDSGSVCNTESSSSNNGSSSYNGSADVTEFLCEMQSPLGNRSYPLCGFVGEDRTDHVHAGVDLSIGAGVPVYAAQTGTVIRAEYFSGYGNCIDIDHGNGMVTRYGHLANFKVKKGDVVTKGQHIGTEGGSGGYPVHLHFELRKNDKPQQAINHYFNYYGSLSATGDCFMNRTNVSEKFKKECGSSWDGEPTGDSAGKKSEIIDYDDSEEDDSDESGSSEKCCDESSSSSSSTSSSSGKYCPNGITVTGLDAGTYDLEDYVERAATCENGGAHTEAVKAQAIAARTFALNATNNCADSIENSTRKQVMSTSTCRKATDKVKKDIAPVRGVVLLNNGNIFSTQYSSFYGSCNGDSCTSTLNKIPSSEKSTFTMPKSYLTTGEKAGHSNGMSQNGANYMATEQGKTYDEILKFFYADGIEITGSTGNNTCVLGKNSFTGKVWPYYQIDYPNDDYGSYGTIATHGCGTTSMAMVVSSFLNEKHDPVELTNYACSNNFCTADGTKHSYFKSAAEKYHIKMKQTTDKDEALSALNRGDSLVIVPIVNSDFNVSSSGHFILLAGGNGKKVVVYDPASKEKSKKSYDFENAIAKHVTNYFIFTADDATLINNDNVTIAKSTQEFFDASERTADKLEAAKFKYSAYSSYGSFKAALPHKVTNCAQYVSWAMQKAGLIPEGKSFYTRDGVILGKAAKNIKNSKNFKIQYVNAGISSLVSSGKLQPGDIVGAKRGWNRPHTMIYQGKKNGKFKFYSVGPGTVKNGHMSSSKISNKGYKGSYNIGVIIRPIWK